ncbi:DUF6497 family protein [Antarctobacter jejuensis]|uniref:DUF6497 family protein n=1 Tax=Antarctobacter jejuensis TaxID=1439938 RepID=UPI003FD54EC0
MSGAFKFIAPGALGGLAALVGGAAGYARWCQSCPPILVGLISLIAVPTFAAAEGQVLPATSLDFTAFDIVSEPPVYRVRYLAPGLADTAVSYVDVAEDMEHLCAQDALPRLVEQGAAPERIVVTLMAEPVEFGAMSPGIRQFFESYAVQDGLCIWESF